MKNFRHLFWRWGFVLSLVCCACILTELGVVFVFFVNRWRCIGLLPSFSLCLSTLVGSVCLSESVVRRSCGKEVLWRSVEAGTSLLLLLSQLYFEKTTIPLLGWSWDLLQRERYGSQGMHPTLVYLCAVGAAKVFPCLVKKLF